MPNIIPITYFSAAVLFILGLKGMSSPLSARKGIVWAGIGMLLATLVTFSLPHLHNFPLMLSAIIIGSAVAYYSGKKVALTNMPQMIALYNGLGGGAAAAIAAVELLRISSASHAAMPQGAAIVGTIGALIGSVAFTGSLIAFAKLQGWMKKVLRFPGQQAFNFFILLITVASGAACYVYPMPELLLAFFLGGLFFGILMTLPIGGADMPVIISLYNALTGLAVGFEGYVLGNEAMIIAGTVVGAAGTLLTQLMAKAMNRSISNILFASFSNSAVQDSELTGKSMQAAETQDVAIMLSYAQKVIIVPGYGLAVAQAQHKVWELCELLLSKGVQVKFAIHPVAGRMPGHMNVLLAEAGVPYELIADLEEINAEFNTTDVAVVIGANDVVNPVARSDSNSPIYGMPILNVDQAQHTVVIKRGKGAGYSGVENALFFAEKTHMLFADAQAAVSDLIQQVKAF